MYDFKSIIPRRNTDSVKWDVKPNELPMWVADMDFKAAPEIIDAMQKKVAFGIFGYEEPHADYFNAVADWYATEHHARPKTAWMLFCTGVVPSISSTVRRVSNVGDNVVVQAPVYNIFYNSIINNGRHILSSDLLYDSANHQYSINWQDLEAKLAEPLSTMMILCNPHNPVGKVWSRDELIKISRLCMKYHVTLFSDEIHGDLVCGSPEYTPVFSLPDDLIQNTIVSVSPSKTFNVAALHAATIIVPNEGLRNIVNRGINTDELGEPNLLAIPGTIAAYTKGYQWLAELKQQLTRNRDIFTNYCEQFIPQIKVIASNATYLVWIDCSTITRDSSQLEDFIRQDTGLYISAGSVYGGNGNQFLRVNIACPETTLQDGLKRLKKGIETYINQK
ncbi:Cystathionine beta-lyase PatB [Lentilactobacillus hilgardii]|uniref:MalY/PatB family protein n=1 Tax=Lentilactobacillus hilgardii TaxID=1588 RepID=UPI00019C5424|nr:MalY/PatB family protein [Lentilactobacillus hilgardii]EEI21083.1 aminotransferase, class I/II [Lentilactobacillus buchneri ATCC 11577]MCT3396166.1 pyridoxal phosphate-dependent aminotransferase [Lentilactobacillus hilgardii]QIR10656.1 Cystathionine beta-lyase PatB [Lentilactobacillus hilgardii]